MAIKTINIVGLAVFKNKKIIMVTNYSDKHAYYFLGGKIEKGETEIEALQREILEEADVEIDLNSLQFLKEFESPAHNHVNTNVNLKLYKGELLGTPVPSTEILDIQYFNAAMGKSNPPRIIKTRI
jgi:8-oxo-dGTP pyrophosphatase MutT (NUDIX family)